MRYVRTPDGRDIPRRVHAVELYLVFHHETELAWLVSNDGDPGCAVFLPKSVCDVDPPCGGFERMDQRCQRVLWPVRFVSMPHCWAAEKGLIAA